jgi:hypothetical protein
MGGVGLTAEPEQEIIKDPSVVLLINPSAIKNKLLT